MLFSLLLAHAEPPLRLALETEAGLEPLPWVISQPDAHLHGEVEPAQRAPRGRGHSPSPTLAPDQTELRIPTTASGPHRVDVWWIDIDDGTDWVTEATMLRRGHPGLVPTPDRSWTVPVEDGAVLVDLASLEPLRTPILVRVTPDREEARVAWANLVQHAAVAVHQVYATDGTWFLASDRATGRPREGVTIRRGPDTTTTDARGVAHLPPGRAGEQVVMDDGTWLTAIGHTPPTRPPHLYHPGWRIGVDRDHLTAGDVVQVAGWVQPRPDETVRWQWTVNRDVFPGAPVEVGPTGAYGFELTVPESETGNVGRLSLIADGPEGERELATRRLRMVRPSRRPVEGLRIEPLDVQVGPDEPLRFRVHTGSSEPTEVDLIATYAPAAWPIGGKTLHVGPWPDPLPPMDNGQRLKRTVSDGEVIQLRVTEAPPYPAWVSLRPREHQGPTASVRVATADLVLAIERPFWGFRTHEPGRFSFSVLDLDGKPVAGVPIHVELERLDRADAPYPHRRPVEGGGTVRTKPSDGGDTTRALTFPEPGPYAIVATVTDARGRTQRTEIREHVTPHPLHHDGPLLIDAQQVSVQAVERPTMPPLDLPHRRVAESTKVPVWSHPQSWFALGDTSWARTWTRPPADRISGEPLDLRVDVPVGPAQVWLHTTLDGETIDQRTLPVPSVRQVRLPAEVFDGRSGGALEVRAVAIATHAPFDTEGWPTVDDPRPHAAIGRWRGVYDPQRSLDVHVRGLRASECQRPDGCATQRRVVVGDGDLEPKAELMLAVDLDPGRGAGADPLPDWLEHPRPPGGGGYGTLPWPSSSAPRQHDPAVRDLPYVRELQSGGFGGRLPSKLPAVDRLDPVLHFTGVVPTDADGGHTFDLPEGRGPFRVWVWARTPDGRTGYVDTLVRGI